MEDIVTWRTSSLSGANGGQCVEVGSTSAGTVAGLRDSKSPERGHLKVTPVTFRDLVAAVKRGELNMSV